MQRLDDEAAKAKILSGSLEDSDESEDDGTGLLPESLQRTQPKGDKPLQSALAWAKDQRVSKPQNTRGKGSGFAKGRPQTIEEDDDEEDPEWVDFDPKKEKAAFFGREIPDEATLREQFEVQKERYGLNKRKNKNPDIEDKMDEMFFKKLEEEEKQRLEHEKVSGQFEGETGGYSDIDIIYAKKQREMKPRDELDDDELDQWIETRQRQKAEDKPEEETKAMPELQKSPEEANDISDQSIELPQGIKDQITDLE